MAYSTAIATRTTRRDTIKPWSIGLAPDLYSFLKSVFSPIAARAAIIRNLLTDFIAPVSAAGSKPKLVRPDIAKNPKINQGKMDLMLTFAALLLASLFLFR